VGGVWQAVAFFYGSNTAQISIRPSSELPVSLAMRPSRQSVTEIPPLPEDSAIAMSFIENR
jgi:hypothetical protein